MLGASSDTIHVMTIFNGLEQEIQALRSGQREIKANALGKTFLSTECTIFFRRFRGALSQLTNQSVSEAARQKAREQMDRRRADMLHSINEQAPKTPELKHHPYVALVEVRGDRVLGWFAADQYDPDAGYITIEEFLRYPPMYGAYLFVDSSTMDTTSLAMPRVFEAKVSIKFADERAAKLEGTKYVKFADEAEPRVIVSSESSPAKQAVKEKETPQEILRPTDLLSVDPRYFADVRQRDSVSCAYLTLEALIALQMDKRRETTTSEPNDVRMRRLLAGKNIEERMTDRWLVRKRWLTSHEFTDRLAHHASPQSDVFTSDGDRNDRWQGMSIAEIVNDAVRAGSVAALEITSERHLVLVIGVSQDGREAICWDGLYGKPDVAFPQSRLRRVNLDNPDLLIWGGLKTSDVFAPASQPQRGAIKWGVDTSGPRDGIARNELATPATLERGALVTSESNVPVEHFCIQCLNYFELLRLASEQDNVELVSRTLRNLFNLIQDPSFSTPDFDNRLLRQRGRHQAVVEIVDGRVLGVYLKNAILRPRVVASELDRYLAELDVSPGHALLINRIGQGASSQYSFQEVTFASSTSSTDAPAAVPSASPFPPRRRSGPVNQGVAPVPTDASRRLATGSPAVTPVFTEALHPSTPRPTLHNKEGQPVDEASAQQAEVVMRRVIRREAVSPTERLRAYKGISAASLQKLEQWIRQELK